VEDLNISDMLFYIARISQYWNNMTTVRVEKWL